jgi:hypothetical protein
VTRPVLYPHLPLSDLRRVGLVTDPTCCPVPAGAGCACDGSCARPMTAGEHAKARADDLLGRDAAAVDGAADSRLQSAFVTWPRQS